MDLSRPLDSGVPGEQFLRHRVRPRRGSGRLLRTLLRWTAATAGLAAIGAAGFWTAAVAGRSPELRVSRIRIEGHQRLSREEIFESLGLSRAASILTVDLDALKKKMLESTWVKDVAISRELPGTLHLEIVERRPVGVAVAGGLRLIDEDGVLLDEVAPRDSGLVLPLVRGLEDGEGERERAALAGRVLAALAAAPDIQSVVSEIDVSAGAESIRVLLRYPPLVILVREADAADRLRDILPLAEGIFERFPGAEALDLRFQNRVYLRLARSHPRERQKERVTASPGLPSNGREVIF